MVLAGGLTLIALLARLVGVPPIAIEAIIVVLLLLCGGFGTLTIYEKGYAAAEGKCEAAAIQAKLDAVEKDRDDARAAAADASLKLAAIKQQADTEKEQTDAYVAELEKRPAPTCALTDDDLRGMRAPVAKPAAAGKGASSFSRWLDATRPGPVIKAR